MVLIEHPLRSLPRSMDFSGCITKWGTQLGVYDIKYKPRTEIKCQIIADFIVEFTPGGAEESRLNQTMIIQHTKKWKLFIDDASNSQGSGLGIILIAPQGQMLEQTIRLGFLASNNVAVYKALLPE